MPQQYIKLMPDKQLLIQLETVQIPIYGDYEDA
jgi:hypothetical protein